MISSMIVLIAILQTSVPGKFGDLGGGVLNRDGTVLFEATGALVRRDLVTNKEVQDPFRAVLVKGPPYRVLAGTWSQGFPHPSDSLVDSGGFCPENCEDALGADRFLLSDNKYSALRPPNYDFCYLFEVRFEKRGSQPNPSWLAHVKRGESIRPVAARFRDSHTIDFWTLETRSRLQRLVHYIADRDHPSQPLRRVSAETTHIPVKNTTARYNPLSRTFLVHLVPNSEREQERFAKMHTSGAVIALVPRNQNPALNPDMQATWDLYVRDDQVPGGKKAWIPLSHSADLSIWLVKSVADGSSSLLRF